jgi:NADP-dependent 3-hydroxy acid dehydrogenase YdfG
VAFSESVMMDVRADNIRVSCIMPGSVATEFSRSAGRGDESWKLTGDDIAEVVVDLLRHPARSLPSRIEIRPAKTKADR